MNEDYSYTNYKTEEQEVSVGKQFLGAGLGMLIGIAIYCLMGLIGYVWWYASILFGVAVYFSYKKIAKVHNLTGSVICGLAILVGIYIGVHMCYAVYFYDWRPNMLKCITDLYTYLNQYDMIPDFIKNLLLSYVGGFAAIISFFTSSLKQLKGTE